jgi:aspartyl/asparaginyl-tRNA synthetase
VGCAHALAYRIDKYPIAAIDVLAPEIGEIIGGGQREDRGKWLNREMVLESAA